MRTLSIDTQKIHDVLTPNLGFFLDQKITGMGSAAIRQTAYNISGGHGGYASKTLYGARILGLTGWVYGTDVITYGANRRALETALRLREDANGLNIPNTIFFTADDGNMYQIKGFPSDFSNDDEGVLKSPFMVNFYCPFPYFLKQAQSNQTIVPPSGGGVVLPFIVPVVIGAQTGGNGVCINNGTAETYPVLTLTGPLTNPTIQNITTGDFITLNITIAAGQVVVIDMNPPVPSIILNGTQSLINNKSTTSSFWYLDVGSNFIVLSTGSVSDTGNVAIAWQDAYLGA